jgi:hypothetical protein
VRRTLSSEIGSAGSSPGSDQARTAPDPGGEVLARPGTLFAAQGNMTGFARWPLLRRGAEQASDTAPTGLDVTGLPVGPLGAVIGSLGSDPSALGTGPFPGGGERSAAAAPGRTRAAAPDRTTAAAPAATTTATSTNGSGSGATAANAAGSTITGSGLGTVGQRPAGADGRPGAMPAPEVLGTVLAGPGLVRRRPVRTPATRVATVPWGPFGRPLSISTLGRDTTSAIGTGIAGAAPGPGRVAVIRRTPAGDVPGAAAPGAVGRAGSRPAGPARRPGVPTTAGPGDALTGSATPATPAGRISRDPGAPNDRVPTLPGFEPEGPTSLAAAAVRPGQVVIRRTEAADTGIAPGTPAGAPERSPRPARPAGDDLADRFLAELARAPRPAPYELPRHARPIAAAIVGDRPVRIATDATTRAALRSVGKRAATAGDVVHLDRPLGTSRDDLAVLAHELTHVAHPSPAPRFFDDDRRGPEERQAEEMAEIIRRTPTRPSGPRRPDAPQIGSARARSAGLPVAPAAGGGSRPATPPPRPSTPPPSGTFSASALAAQVSGGAAAADPLTPVVQERSTAPTPSASSGVSAASADDGSAAAQARSIGVTLDQFDRLVEMLQDRIISEIERRGGRNRGGF